MSVLSNKAICQLCGESFPNHAAACAYNAANTKQVAALYKDNCALCGRTDGKHDDACLYHPARKKPCSLCGRVHPYGLMSQCDPKDVAANAAAAGINHPAHYGGEGATYEAIKVIEAWQLGFHLGNAVKYICRAGRKRGANMLDDLRKARWYLDRAIEGNGAEGKSVDMPVVPERIRPDG